MKRILVIKFAALGDFAQAFGMFETIRRAHPSAHITLLTTPPYADLARDFGMFDAIETDGRPKGWRAHWRMLNRLRRARFDRVYDLQNNNRSSTYLYALLPFAPQWSGVSRLASHRQTRPDRGRLHNLDRMADQLHVAGIAPPLPAGGQPGPDLSWAAQLSRGEHASVAQRFALPTPFAVLAPGASPVKPQKLWPLDRYAALAEALQRRGLTPAVIGGPSEAPLAEAIRQAAPSTIDLTGRTAMVDLAGIGSEARLCVGNDSGPTHMAAYGGAPGLMLMSSESKPWHCGPRARMRCLESPDLADLPVTAVLEALEADGLFT